MKPTTETLSALLILRRRLWELRDMIPDSRQQVGVVQAIFALDIYTHSLIAQRPAEAVSEQLKETLI